MKATKNKVTVLILALVLIISVSIFAVLNFKSASLVVSAETFDAVSDNFIVTESAETVDAIYDFTRLNDSECSVRIANKTVATKAIIPSTVEMDGKTYRVTEVAANGFLSSPKLVRVGLPYTIKKIGNMAFANCAALERISMANVQEIGTSAFYNCPKLSNLVIPKSVHTIGAYILRNNDTQVRVRAESEGEGWVSTWNSNNSNQNVEFNSKYIEKLELEAIRNANSRSSEIIGYAVAEGQPRVDNFYGEINDENRDDFLDENDNIFIPAQYNGIDVVTIKANAFLFAYFNQLIIEYSQKPINLEESAFALTFGNSITINRPINFEGNSTFAASDVISIVLPDTLEKIVDEMFSSCTNLTNIYFCEPEFKETQAEMLNIVDEQAQKIKEHVVKLPSSHLTTIGNYAFSFVNLIHKLHIPNNVRNVGKKILEYWDNNEQIVFVHNEDKIPDYNTEDGSGWDSEWAADFTNIIYDKSYYTITLDPNGGDPLNPENQNVILGMNYTLPIPTRTGYDFVGWYSEEVGGVQYTYSNGESINVWEDTEDKTLYAHWEAKEFTVTLELNGGDYVNPKSDNVTFHRTYSLPIPTHAGYDFIGWYSEEVGGVQYTDSEGKSINRWEDTEDKTLYAHWKAKDYVITIEINGYAYSVTVTFDKEYSLPVPGADIGYEFVGWYYDSIQYTDATGKSLGVWKDTSNRTLTAKQNALTYYITADYSGYGDSVIRSVVYEPKRNMLSLFSSPTNLDSKLQFAGWYLDETFDMPLPSSMEGIDANILNSSSHAFTIYAKLTVNNSNTEFTVPEKCTRLYFGSANSNLRIIIPKVIKTSSLIFENFVSIQTSNVSVIDIWEAESTTYLYFKGNNELKGGDGANGANGADGSPAINCKGLNLYINVINDGSLELIGGDGGAGTYYGGNGAPGLFVTNDLDFKGTSDNKNSYYPPYEYEGVIHSDIIILGGNGGSGTYSGGNGGNGVTVTLSDYVSGNRIWFTLKYTSLFIRGGNGGDITNKDINGNGIGGNGGNGFECNNDAYFFKEMSGSMVIYGGNGGDSGTSTDALGSCGGYGIYSHWGNIGIYTLAEIFGGNAGNHKFGKISGGIGLKCNKLISGYIIEITGGQGSSSDITRFCGTGGTAATIEAISGSGYSIIFRGGKGGMNTIKGEKGGLGYTFSNEEKFNSVIYYNGEDWTGED